MRTVRRGSWSESIFRTEGTDPLDVADSREQDFKQSELEVDRIEVYNVVRE